WSDRLHFFAIAARIMRRVLVDGARARGYQKRGAGVSLISFDEGALAAPARGAELVRLDDALQELAAMDERKARVVELRYFGGLSVDEIAEVLKISSSSVLRDWKPAKAWLSTQINPRRRGARPLRNSSPATKK